MHTFPTLDTQINMGPRLLPAALFKSSNPPLVATLVPTISLAYGLQGLAAIPSILAQSERYYDLSGSLTYLSCTALSLYLPVFLRATKVISANAAAGSGSGKITSPLMIWQSLGRTLVAGGGRRNWRQIALSAAVGIWATRCVYNTYHAPHPPPPPVQSSPVQLALFFFFWGD